MPIREIREGDFEELRKLFLDYYEELDCEDDADELYEEYLIPDLKADLLSRCRLGRRRQTTCIYYLSD